MFKPVECNPLERAAFDPEDWVCYPAKVGEILMFIYFHKRYLSLGTSLSNLLEMAEAEEIEGKKPDAILVFGVEPDVLGPDETVYYEDKANEVIVGVIGRTEQVDYFGYLKKMALTLHNLLQIDRGNLPIHGSHGQYRLAERTLCQCNSHGRQRSRQVRIVGGAADFGR